MKLSEIIREYVDLKIDGEPQSSEWRSTDADFDARRRYYERLDELERAIDALVPETSQGEQSHG